MEQLSQQSDAGRVLGWVIAANDLALTFYLQEHFHKLIENMHIREFTVGSQLYIDRLMCAQANEAILMAPLCRNSALFRQCIATHTLAEEAFERLLKLNQDPVPDESKDLAQLLSRVRNKGMFHYYSTRDRNIATWLQQAITYRARAGERRGVAIHSQDHLFTRYSFADDVFGEVFFRKILQANISDEQTVHHEIVRLSTLLVDAASDVRVVGDTVGKALVERFPL